VGGAAPTGGVFIVFAPAFILLKGTIDKVVLRELLLLLFSVKGIS
jgi:hypothetical protein